MKPTLGGVGQGKRPRTNREDSGDGEVLQGLGRAVRAWEIGSLGIRRLELTRKPRSENLLNRLDPFECANAGWPLLPSASE